MYILLFLSTKKYILEIVDLNNGQFFLVMLSYIRINVDNYKIKGDIIMINNIPNVKLGIIAVSRDCFPMSLSASRRRAVVDAYKNIGGDVYECPITVENEIDMQKK